MKFRKLDINNNEELNKMSNMATSILREHYDPILGKEQNDYMLEKFQSVSAIKEQVLGGYEYYFAVEGEEVGFLAFYKKDKVLYLSKLYLKKECRGKGYGRKMVEFTAENAKKYGLSGVELNVNKYNYDTIKAYEKMGFVRIRDEKNDIGSGYFMDDFVYLLEVKKRLTLNEKSYIM